MWEKSTGEFFQYEMKPKEKAFNIVRVSSDDQEYTYVEKDEPKAMETENIENEEPEPKKTKHKRALRSKNKQK